MGAGKLFCIIGGIITLLATFLFSFAPFIYGLGLFLNLPLIFSLGTIVEIIITIVFIIFSLAGLFIILGVKSKAVAIIGSIFALALGVYFMLSFYGVLPLEVAIFTLLFGHVSLGAFPLLNTLMLGYAGLGTYLLLVGGVLGLIGGIMGPDDF